ncbi:acyltransferase family protein [Leifsonia poae]|uniref:acyltransferase family protein n=1 Tax=Leifsonia poae TaxID=110933 RepID=UPI003D684532
MKFSPLTQAGALLIGCATAFLVEKRPWQSRTAAYIAGGALAAVIIFACFVDLPYVVLKIAVAALMPLVLLHLAFGQSLMVRLFSVRPVVYIGLISYAIYLWHYPILQALHHSGFGLRGSAVVAVPLTLAAAVASQYLVERPFNKLKDRIGTRNLARPTRTLVNVS